MHIPTSLAITLSLLSKRQAFETYDSCANSCFDENLVVFASQCTETVGSQGYIACVCGNTGFDFSSASCIFTQCGATILNQTATQHDYNCNLNGSPPVLDTQQFIAAGFSDSGDSSDSSYTSILSSYLASLAAATASVPAATTHALPTETTKSPSTSTSKAGGSNPQTTTRTAGQESATQTSSQAATSSSSSSSNSGSNTLSTGALVGSIVGSITGAIASFTTVYFGWKTYKMKKAEKKEKAAAQAQAQAAGE